MLACNGDILIDNSISLKNQPVNYRRVVNFSEADPLFPEFITGLEMIDLFVSAKNGAKNQKETLIESMKMGDYIKGPVRSYSSGMLKKLSLLMAIFITILFKVFHGLMVINYLIAYSVFYFNYYKFKKAPSD